MNILKRISKMEALTLSLMLPRMRLMNKSSEKNSIVKFNSSYKFN